MKVTPTIELSLEGPSSLKHKNNVWLIIAICLALLPIMGYGVLPLIGITTFYSKFQPDSIIKLIVLFLGGIGAILYIRWSISKPPATIPIFLVAYWQVVSYVNGEFINPLGIDIKLRLLIILGLSIPAAFYVYKWRTLIFKELGFLKYFAFFVAINLFYYQFYGATTQVVKGISDGAWAAGNFGLVKVLGHIITVTAVIVSYTVMRLAKDPRSYILSLGKHLMWVTALTSILFVVTYPTKMYSYILDGFLRSFGFLDHPNPFAHHMGIILLVLVGLMTMGQQNKDWKIKGLGWGVFFSCFGFLVGLSKTAIISFIVATSVFWLPQLLDPQNRVSVMKAMVGLAIGCVLLNYMFGWVSGQTLVGVFMSRLEQPNSVDSRMGDWWILISQINASNILFGQGHTAANQAILLHQFSANDGSPALNIHNAYVEVLFDYGLLGLSVLIAAFTNLTHGIKIWFKGNNIQKPIGLTIVALSIYFLMVCSFDEMLYMYDASHLYWIFSALFIVLAIRLNNNKENPHKLKPVKESHYAPR